ncbi:hypothetical protein HPB52_009959 [Rhipicephalus sanguineus]|uniref:Uncharacterized protein n=1 Tax=Rhipicephalus sanguineus TaxID=34632 RepID=A0A9D4PC65_RHISA|nr:hypothetical protein HPB52_009959 [Rhipicephalus sanguineus]
MFEALRAMGVGGDGNIARCGRVAETQNILPCRRECPIGHFSGGTTLPDQSGELVAVAGLVMSASFLVAPVRCLAATLLVCSLVVLTLPSVCTARNLHKRSFLELGCRGNFEQSYLARLERVCEECYQLYRDPEAYNRCRMSCFKNEDFGLCAEALLLKDEMTGLRRMVNYVYG